MELPKEVCIIEVGPRDGLQNEAQQLPVEVRTSFVEALAAAGLPRIQLGAFVHPRWVPQMAGSEEVAARVLNGPWGTGRAGAGAAGTPSAPPAPAGPSPVGPAPRFSALVPNVKGYERALAAGLREIDLVTSTTETFNRKNLNMSIAESLDAIALIVERAKRDGVRLRVDVSVSFGCPFEGEVHPEQVVGLARSLYEMGLPEIALADTNGVANPVQVYDLFRRVREWVPLNALAAHFHDTRGLALANALAAAQAGVWKFDASAGGLGGCPFSPGATGNVATEDLVYLFTSMGVKTGVDLEALARAARQVLHALGKPPESRYLNLH